MFYCIKPLFVRQLQIITFLSIIKEKYITENIKQVASTLKMIILSKIDNMIQLESDKNFLVLNLV
jgi:hypothetical protein